MLSFEMHTYFLGGAEKMKCQVREKKKKKKKKKTHSKASARSAESDEPSHPHNPTSLRYSSE